MKLTNTQRVMKLLDNLGKNPDLILPWIKHSVLTKKMPIDWDLPWWSYRAIAYADASFKGKKIFEYGTGGSTLRFAKIAKSVTSVEDNDSWMAIVKERLEQATIKNVNIKYCPFNFEEPKDFKSSEYIHAFNPDEKYDVVIIDGQDTTFNERIDCFQLVEQHIAEGGIIVVDDWWRYHKLKETTKAKKIVEFESVGPCRYGVTSTAFFHY